ncbi:MAG: A24 family peptidase [Nanoarchaeota archaeon]|nr:A24 family peptidase [Nanoarchaeota archaeon]
MQQHYFLFALALIWTLFATVQDIKTREVANWLNFSLIAIGLSYSAFFAAFTKNIDFFLLGLFGFIIFFALAHIFYYSRAFAGGDAKLLMGFGAILPYSSYFSLVSLTLCFLFSLFLIGAVYSLIYSFFIIIKNKEKFIKELTKLVNKWKKLLIITPALFIILVLLFLTGSLFNLFVFWSLFFILVVFPWLWLYTKSLDLCMISLTPPEKLTEGDWLEKNVKVGNKTIKKTVHGLSLQDIKLLKKHKISVKIKQGIPFVPAFLLTLIILIFFLPKLSALLSLFGL